MEKVIVFMGNSIVLIVMEKNIIVFMGNSIYSFHGKFYGLCGEIMKLYVFQKKSQ